MTPLPPRWPAIPVPQPITTPVRGLDPQAWGFPNEAAMLTAWGLDDWPCTSCGLIGCEHDDELPEYRGAFDTEGRH